MARMKKIAKGVLLMGIFSMLLGFLNGHSQQAEAESGGYAISQPVVMVPGTGATVDRFDKLITSLKKTYSDIDVLKITVNEDGSLNVTGGIDRQSQHPVIVIGFANSSDETLQQQGGWYQKALVYAQNRYHFDSYDYLGHSNGGLVITQYLENDQQVDDPHLDNLITLGTPYNYTEWADNADSDQLTTVKNETAQLQDYLAKATAIPTTIQMLNIAGSKDGQNTDGTVPLTSVLAGQLIYGNSASYDEVTVAAGHSDLVTNSEVQNQIIKTFWQEKTTRN